MMKKEENKFMMDLLMLAILAVSFGLVGLLIHWCRKQVDANE